MAALELSEKMLAGETFTLKEKLSIVTRLSVPGILAQISDIIMQYIDAAMVGVLGAAASASIGLVASATWLLGGLLGAAASGFSVQAAHAAGAGDIRKASSVFRQSLLSTLIFSCLIAAAGIWISGFLPVWLGGEQGVCVNASAYLRWFCIFIPVRQLCRLCSNMLQCSGDMKTPSILMTLMCFLDVVFNWLLIFPARVISFAGFDLRIPGAGLGVLGAQLGTSLSVLAVTIPLLYFSCVKSEVLNIFEYKGRWTAEKEVLRTALSIGIPMAMENSAMCLAQLVSTKIIAPLGTEAIAAHSFAVTAESVCYMPGYGISVASTTMVGQSVGAKRKDLARSFAWLTVFSGIAVMTFAGAVMYFMCPHVFAFLTPVEQVRQLGAEILRIELFAEPMFAASIVAAGALRGAGDTLVPGLMNLFSMWGVRIPLAWILSKTAGLHGVWIAMALELTVRGILFLIRLKRERWLNRVKTA